MIPDVDNDSIVYLNGEHVRLGDAKVSVLDRGFVFGDGIYEVVPVYNGKPFRMAEHITRLQRSLNETEMLLFEGTMKDIDEKIEEIVKERGISLVLDKSAIRPGAPVPVVLWSAASIDITEELVKRIGGTIKADEPGE